MMIRVEDPWFWKYKELRDGGASHEAAPEKIEGEMSIRNQSMNFQRGVDLIETRAEAHRHIMEMSGLDDNGCILPPPKDFEIDRTAVTWWRNR